MQKRVLIIDDKICRNNSWGTIIADALAKYDEDYKIEFAQTWNDNYLGDNYVVEGMSSKNWKKAEEELLTFKPDLILLDQIFESQTKQGREILKKIKLSWKQNISDATSPPVIVMTVQEKINKIFNFFIEGASDYIKKIDIDNTRKITYFKNQLYFKTKFNIETPSITNIMGFSSHNIPFFQEIIKYAKSNNNILVLGESGTGKELVAHALHELSPRKEKEFVPVSIGGLPNSLIDSELFGYTEGAFTGASKDKKGKFAIADGGAIFLDEVVDLDYDMQAKILRTLDSGMALPIGIERKSDYEPTDYKFNFRTLAATNKDFVENIGEDNFRFDLFMRLYEGVIKIPPLRARKEDIKEIAAYLLSRFVISSPIKLNLDRISGFEKGSVEIMQNYEWPGNIRELRNVLKQAFANDIIYNRNHLITEKSLTEILNSNFRRKIAAAIKIEKTRGFGQKIVQFLYNTYLEYYENIDPTDYADLKEKLEDDNDFLTFEKIKLELGRKLLKQVKNKRDTCALLFSKRNTTFEQKLK